MVTVALPRLRLGRNTLAILVQLSAAVAGSDLQGRLPAGHGGEGGCDLGPCGGLGVDQGQGPGRGGAGSAEQARGFGEEVGVVLKQVCSLYCRLWPGREVWEASRSQRGLRSRTQSSGRTREPQVDVRVQQVGSAVPGRVS